MRKVHLLALAISTILATQSAHSALVFDKWGTKLNLNVQLRLKTTVTSEDHSMNIKDDGSRFGFSGSHQITDDFKVTGKLEYGVDTQKTNSQGVSNSFNLYNRVGYIGLEYAGIGTINFGRTYIPIDWVKKSSYGYGNTGVFYFSDVLSRSTGSDYGSLTGSNTSNNIYSNGVGSNNFMTRLPQTIFVQTADYNGFHLAGTYSGKSGEYSLVEGDVTSAYSIVGFYQSNVGLTVNMGYSTAFGSENFKTKAKPQDSILALGIEYFFPGRQFSVGVDYGQSRAINPIAAYKYKGKAKHVKGDWKANLVGIGGKWHWDNIESGLYAGYYLRDGDANTYNYRKQTVTVGVDKRFRLANLKSVLLFAETAYDMVSSDNINYNSKHPGKDLNQYIFSTGARIVF